MRIKEELKKSGYFWLPENEDKKIPGNLSILDGGEIELEVVGLFDESIEALNGNDDLGICQHSCHPYLNQATKTSVGITRLDGRTGLRAVG